MPLAPPPPRPLNASVPYRAFEDLKLKWESSGDTMEEGEEDSLMTEFKEQEEESNN